MEAAGALMGVRGPGTGPGVGGGRGRMAPLSQLPVRHEGFGDRTGLEAARWPPAGWGPGGGDRGRGAGEEAPARARLVLTPLPFPPVHAPHPPLSVVCRFAHLLNQSQEDFLAEAELLKLQEEVVRKIRSNQQLQQDLDLMDLKIGLLVKNRITLQVRGRRPPVGSLSLSPAQETGIIRAPPSPGQCR